MSPRQTRREGLTRGGLGERMGPVDANLLLLVIAALGFLLEAFEVKLGPVHPGWVGLALVAIALAT